MIEILGMMLPGVTLQKGLTAECAVTLVALVRLVTCLRVNNLGPRHKNVGSNRMSV